MTDEQIIERLRAIRAERTRKSDCEALTWAVECVKQVPRKISSWQMSEHYSICYGFKKYMYFCKDCGRAVERMENDSDIYILFRFCPRCGAYMSPDFKRAAES